MAKKYWLMKSEPEIFSIDQLKKEKTTLWEGVRNYQARNFMMNDMKVGDLILFYHSNAEPPGVAGLARVSAPATPDPTAFQKKSPYYDPKATLENPIWQCVEIAFVEKFKNFIPLEQLRSHSKLASMLVLKKGQRLSIQSVTTPEFKEILELAESSFGK